MFTKLQSALVVTYVDGYQFNKAHYYLHQRHEHGRTLQTRPDICPCEERVLLNNETGNQKNISFNTNT